MSLPKYLQVALLIDTATDWGRRMIRGIAQYAQQQGGWDLWLEQRCQHAPGRLPPGWRGDGIIARVADRAMARHLTRAHGLVVNVSTARVPGADFPTVTADLHAAAKLAIRHLLDQGFRHFAYYAPMNLSFVEDHHHSFVETLAELGYSCALLHAPGAKRPREGWQKHQKSLERWIRDLPKPVAVLTWTGRRGREVIYACRALGLSVPEQVAVLGADDDALLCETCNPPLSALALTSEQIGFEAAALLDRMLRGAKPPARPVLIEPTRVIVRQSTDTLAIDDEDVARAIAFIRMHTAQPIQVRDILRAVPVSRRSLDRRFQQVLGRTPADEIRRVHLERAKQLLADTDMPVPNVAAASGFRSREYLARAFKQETGLSPRQYRNRVQGRA
jgi:LacI family transcriptional regulator